MPCYGQLIATAPLSGVVQDPSGAVIPGAEIVAKNDATGAEFKATSADNGTWTIPGMAAGMYTVTVTAPAFKQAVVRNVKILAATPSTVNVNLELGTPAESVIVQGGAEVLQTQTSTVSTTIVGRQITELPFISRDGLDLVMLLPGTSTPGRPRTSTIDGLPKSSINITIDGVNVQDNLIKNTDGFFTYIRPRVDAVEEVTVSTSNPGAESSAEGAVQIKFVTRQGSNAFHGSLYEYHRNPALNANYWFNNRDVAPDPRTGKAPRDRVLLNQFGGRLGGPIIAPKLFNGRDKAFFFVNYEEYRLPEQYSRSRWILHPRTQQGFLRYLATDASGNKSIKEVDMMALAAANGQISTFDPTVKTLLADIRKAAESQGAIEVQEDPNKVGDPNLQRYTFQPRGWQRRYFPTVRFDFNISSKHHLENVYNYQGFRGAVDFLNSTDPAFPGFPNKGSQGSNRFTETIALRSTLTPRLVNEFRFGLSGGTVLFFTEASPADFSGSIANQAGFNLGINAADGITTATAVNGPSRRNTPVKNFTDTVTWTKGTHNLSFGWNLSQLSSYQWSIQLVPTISFGVDVDDPAYFLFTSANQPKYFPGGNATDASRAAGIYATLTGRVTQIAGNANLNETTGKYVYIGPAVTRYRMREMGSFVSDSWRWKPNFTVNFGLRWEVQFPVEGTISAYSKMTLADVWGESGMGNLFKPGTMTGKATSYTAYTAGETFYGTLWKNFAPNLGFAWTPRYTEGILSRLFGKGGQSVFRAGASIAYNREQMGNFGGILTSTPGRTISATRSKSLGNLVAGTPADPWPLLLSQKNRLGPPTFNDTPSYPYSGVISDGGGVFDPNFRLPYVASWNFGYQREVSKNTVIEFRYTGNRAIGMMYTWSPNEFNLVENGVFKEFLLAQNNLYANMAGGKGNTWAYTGIAGTSPLPIAMAYLHGLSGAAVNDPTKYTSSQFRNGIQNLSRINPNPNGHGILLDGQVSQRANALAAGLPLNFFIANPNKRGTTSTTALPGGPYVRGNGYRSYYDAGTVELRRRLARGLLAQASYAFARSFDVTRYSMRLPLYKTPMTYTSAHNFKANWIWELPIGSGKWLASGANRIIDRFIGGWEWHGTARIQSGSPNWISGVTLVGMTRQELQDAMGLYFDDAAKIITFLPDDIRLNTIRAFNTDVLTSTGYSTSRGVPAGRYIAPANTNCIAQYSGQCGHGGFTLRGPMFTRFDLSLVKKTRISEQVNFELRAEFLNAFNNINFMLSDPSADSGSVNYYAGYGSDFFSRVMYAYRDLSTTNDPGGRMIQFVARINF